MSPYGSVRKLAILIPFPLGPVSIEHDPGTGFEPVQGASRGCWLFLMAIWLIILNPAVDLLFFSLAL